MTTIVNCPTCGRSVLWEPASRWRPFCCERCRLIDLGDWLDENHRIASSLGEESAGWSEADSGEPSIDDSDATGGDALRQPRH
ncbi:MAG TPA: DNA gyrase inhibitor YacG [Chromatiaceae bacterium]|nr:MAG: DNA gyrase inhibitor YacG [Thiohalocapsa sp. PB-PSB1]HBG96744.1 DNA gyrase inhibitor YacG [Chromatiaceae bacterium]HCS90416.1 DNA gyrase inhibitor YacG [Chromatiaceae bacterium]